METTQELQQRVLSCTQGVLGLEMAEFVQMSVYGYYPGDLVLILTLDCLEGQIVVLIDYNAVSGSFGDFRRCVC